MKKVEEQNQNIDSQSQYEESMELAEQNINEVEAEQENQVEQNLNEQELDANSTEEQTAQDQDMKEDSEENQQCEDSEVENETQDGEPEQKKKSKKEKNDKEDKEKIAILESILFAMGDSVEVSRLAQVIEETPRKTRNLLLELQKKYKRDKRGIDIIELEDSFQMCTKPDMYEYLVKIAKVPRKYTLSDTVLETLSIVAYKQPVTRIEIEKIRGVSCDHAVNRLLEFDLIKEVGRLDAPGRPLLFGTTEQFLRSFGVKSLEELPQLNQDRVEEFREEAEQEIQLKLDI